MQRFATFCNVFARAPRTPQLQTPPFRPSPGKAKEQKAWNEGRLVTKSLLRAMENEHARDRGIEGYCEDDECSDVDCQSKRR